MTISPTVAVIAFAGGSLSQDSVNLMRNFHNLVGLSFGFAFVRIFVSNYYVVGLELVLLVPATDAKRLKQFY